MRAKSVVHTRQKKKKYFRLAKGYYATKKNRWRMTIQQLEKSLRYAYTDRKDKKANFRQIWIVRLNAAVRENGHKSYSTFIAKLKKTGFILDRKVLAEFASEHPIIFARIAKQVA